MNYKYLLLGGYCLVNLASCSQSTIHPERTHYHIQFEDVSDKAGLVSVPTWKYGGPSISDLNNDGLYDFLLTNHDKTPIQLFMSTEPGHYKEIKGIHNRVDLHGIASGDYDLDGDNDVLISLGGGNGTRPQPQRLLRNDNGTFTDVTVEAGISKMGARGRSVRWIDLDNDGDLDFMQVNAKKVIDEKTPRNILFENMGDGTFHYRKSPAFENMDAERVLVTDFDNDKRLDLLAFTGYEQTSLWQGTGDFEFKDVSEAMFPPQANGYPHTITAAHADIDNDGDLDYYLARGKLLYGLANNSISFNKKAKLLDLRDEGNKSHDGIDLITEGPLTLSDFSHFPRARRLAQMPTFIGKSKKKVETPDQQALTLSPSDAEGFPEEINETGWYIGYIGDNTWRVEWKLDGNLAWDIRGSFSGVSDYKADWTPQNANIPDVLLINEGGRFRDASDQLPQEVISNNWGVTVGDFNNDGKDDFFVHRFGQLKEREADAILINQGQTHFTGILTESGTTEIGRNSHGDGGTAFDFDLDGKIDLLNGDDDNGQWHLYKNVSTDLGHYLLIDVGYSEKGTDPMGARIYVTSDSGKQYKIVGSTSANHSQSLLDIAHFGLGHAKTANITIEWRDGSSETKVTVKANQKIKFGK